MSREIDDVLKSALSQKNVLYRVLIPDVYEQGERRYPVLYLLHGLFGTFENWTELTNLGRYIQNLPLIVVMPDGGDGWYTDTTAGEANERYLIEELIPAVDGAFRTIPDRNSRAIAGNSMGGYGAFKFALKYPSFFCLAGSFSGAFHAPKLSGPAQNSNWEELGPSISRVFGAAESSIRSENDLKQIVNGLGKMQIEALPYFYFECATQDGFLPVNRELDEAFTAAGILHEYHEIDGGHDWAYWDGRIRSFLDLAAEKLKISGAE